MTETTRYKIPAVNLVLFHHIFCEIHANSTILTESIGFPNGLLKLLLIH